MSYSATENTQSIPVYQAVDFYAVNGANLHDPISFAAELELDDSYELRPNVRQYRLSVIRDDTDTMIITPNTMIGHPGARVHLDCCLTLMCSNGIATEALILVETDSLGDVAETYVLPLSQLKPRMGYTLVGIDTDIARTKFAEVACVSFARGTHITMASGEQKLIQDLAAGDRVLTRDDGPQTVRWIGQSTVRAVGDFAPIRIRAGTLHNENDLLVSPDHRLFIFQHSDELGTGRHEVLVRARHLVNGDSVVQQSGGFIDYYQLLFDRHQIIYAEGIAAETLLIDPRTRAVLPASVANETIGAIKTHAHRPHMDYELTKAQVAKHPNAAAVLKRATTR